MESLNAILPTPPTSPKRVLGQGGQAATLRCSRAALGLLLSTLATHESRFFAELPNHLIEYLDSLPAFRAFQLARSKRGLPPSRAYYLHRYELCAVVAGLKPCLLLGFGNAHSNELAVELDDRWIEQVWEETLLELEKIGREDNERGKLALELFEALAPLVLEPIDFPLRSASGVFTNHYTIHLSTSTLAHFIYATFHEPTPESDGWTEADDEDVALALDYPVIHPGPEQGILDIEYRDSGTQEVAFTYYAGKDAIEDVNAHFRRYRDAFAGIAGLELWVSNEKVL